MIRIIENKPTFENREIVLRLAVSCSASPGNMEP